MAVRKLLAAVAVAAGVAGTAPAQVYVENPAGQAATGGVMQPGTMGTPGTVMQGGYTAPMTYPQGTILQSGYSTPMTYTQPGVVYQGGMMQSAYTQPGTVYSTSPTVLGSTGYTTYPTYGTTVSGSGTPVYTSYPTYGTGGVVYGGMPATSGYTPNGTSGSGVFGTATGAVGNVISYPTRTVRRLFRR